MKLSIDTTPFYPLSPEMRLGWLNNQALCIKSHTKFIEGCYYEIQFYGNKETTSYEKVGFFGAKDLTKLSYNYGIMAVAKDTSIHSYSLEDFVKFWEVPDVEDIATRFPQAYSNMKNRVIKLFEEYKLKKYNFQIEDLARLSFKQRAILAWAPGGGKTLGSLIWLRVQQHLLKDFYKRILIVAPQDLIQQWIDTAKMVGIELRRITYPQRLDEGYYICHYEYVRNITVENTFDLLIVDEVTKIKGNNGTERAEAVRSIKAPAILGLTGTPIKNMIKDIHYIFSWLFNRERYPFKREMDFVKTFGTYTTDGNLIPEISHPYLLWKYITPNVLYRDKDDFGVNLVEKRIHYVSTEFKEKQLQQYRAIESKNFLADKNNLQEIVSLFPDNNKIQIVKIIGDRVFQLKEQLVVFVYHQALAIRFKDYFQNKCRLATGLQSATERSLTIASFKRGEFPILIAGLEAMSMGHDLHNCSKLVVCEYPWDYTTLQQAIDRVHRLNSPRPVDIFMVYIEGSVDEMLINLIKEKEEASKIALQN